MANELVVRNEEALKELLIPAGQGTGALWTSLTDDGSREAKARILNAIDSAENLRDYGKPILVENVLIHQVEIESESGETVQAVRTVFISPDGEAYATVSNGVISSLRKIFPLFGMPPWNPPLKIATKEQKTRKGFRTLRLEVLAE